MTSQVEIVEVSPRDGLQNHPVLLPTRDKVALVRKAAAAGARRIEAVSFVNPKAVPQMADAEAVLQGLKDEADLAAQGVRLIGLVLNRRGFDRAAIAGVDEVNFVVVASETFNRRNQGASIDQTLAQIAEAVPLAAHAELRIGVTIAAAFGCPFEGEVSEAQVGRLAAELAGLGVAEIAIADTIGVGDPAAVVRRVGIVRAAAPFGAAALPLPQHAQYGPGQRLRRLDGGRGGTGRLARRRRWLPLRPRRHRQHPHRRHPLYVQPHGR